MKKRILALIMCVCMLFSASMLSGAADAGALTAEQQSGAEEEPLQTVQDSSAPDQTQAPADSQEETQPDAELPLPDETDSQQPAEYELEQQVITGTASDGASVEKDIDGSNFTAVRSGYTLLGWSLEADDSSGEFTRGESFSISGRKTATLYAIWGANPVTLTFKTDGHGTLEDLTSTSGTITKVVPKGTNLATMYANGEYPKTTASSGYSFDHWDITSGTANSNKTITAYFKTTAPTTASYTVNYYKDAGNSSGFLGSASLTGSVGSAISVAAGSSVGQLDWKKPASGYKSGVQQNSASISADGSSSVNVLYAIDPSQTKTLAYTVNYNVNGTVKDSYSVSKTVQILQSDTLSVENITLRSYSGFKYSCNSQSLALNSANTALVGSGTIANGGVITVNYVPVETNVTVTMHVLGQYADLTREFTGKLQLSYYAAGISGNVSEAAYSLQAWRLQNVNRY